MMMRMIKYKKHQNNSTHLPLTKTHYWSTFIAQQVYKTCYHVRILKQWGRQTKTETHQLFIVSLGRPDALPDTCGWRRVRTAATVRTRAAVIRRVQSWTHFAAVCCNHIHEIEMQHAFLLHHLRTCQWFITYRQVKITKEFKREV